MGAAEKYIFSKKLVLFINLFIFGHGLCLVLIMKHHSFQVSMLSTGVRFREVLFYIKTCVSQSK